MFTSLGALLMTTAVAYNNGALYSQKPPMGWSSMYALGQGSAHPQVDYCDETSVKATADAMVSLGMDATGYKYLILDDCWAGQRNASGFIQADTTRFPNGMKPVVDYVHSKGLAFGLYTEAGAKTCVGGRPGSRGHYQDDSETFAEWGVDYVKIDSCDMGGINIHDAFEVFSKYLNATGRPMHVNLVGAAFSYKWGNSIAQSWQVFLDHQPTWNSTAASIERSREIARENPGQPFGWNDLGLLQTGNIAQAAVPGNMSPMEYRTEFTMWAIAASPLIVTTPLLNCTSGTCQPYLTPTQQAILLNNEVVAINQDVTPSGRMIPHFSETELWVRELSDGSRAVALYNEAADVLTGSFSFENLGWTNTTVASVRDLWAGQDLGTFTAKFPGTSVYGRSAQLFRVTKVSDY